MIVAVANTKGGVGKTSLALNLAIARRMEGRDVLLIDADTQQSSLDAIAIRTMSKRQPAIALASYTDGPLLFDQVSQQKSKYEDIVIDVGGRDTGALRAALMVADKVLVPFQPRTFDVWGVTKMSKLINEARSMGVKNRIYGILSMADPSGKDNADAIKEIAGIKGIEYLDSPVGRRKAIADAAGSGLCVLEYSPSDPKARYEIRRLVEVVFDD